MEKGQYLKIVNGNVIKVGENGGMKTFYGRGDAVRAYFNHYKGMGIVEVHLKNGNIHLINISGSILKTI